jgi:uncharacterized protein (TIGR03435 family)
MMRLIYSLGACALGLSTLGTTADPWIQTAAADLTGSPKLLTVTVQKVGTDLSLLILNGMQFQIYVLRLSLPVVDQTGVKADHIDLASFVQPLLDAAIAAQKDGADSMAVEIAVLGAVQKLGLRLEPRKASMTALVITHIDSTPTPD